MSKPIQDLRKKMSPSRIAKNQAAARKLISEIALKELRKSLAMTQEEIAHILRMKQASVSKLENQEDMYVSTLSKFVTALGGKLKLIASFGDREVLLNQFDYPSD